MGKSIVISRDTAFYQACETDLESEKWIFN
jgi:hypothetical protein